MTIHIPQRNTKQTLDLQLEHFLDASNTRAYNRFGSLYDIAIKKIQLNPICRRKLIGHRMCFATKILLHLTA